MTADGQQVHSTKSFLLLWSGQAFSLLGSQLVQFALVWWLVRATGSATTLALASLVALLPQIVIGPFAGALIDRWRRRTVMIVADAASAAATAALAGLFWLDRVDVGTIYAFLLLRSVAAAFHWPAMQASTTLMVPEQQLARIGGLNQVLAGTAAIFIPPLGALAVDALPMQGVLAIDVASAIPAIASLLVINVPQPMRAMSSAADGGQPSVWADMRDGLRFVLGWRAFMLLVLVGVIINALGRAAGALTPLLVMEHFGGGAAELGWWQSATGVGTLIGGAVLGVWGGFRRRVVTQMLLLIPDGLAIMLIGLSAESAFLLAVGLVFLIAMLEAIVLGLGGAIFQAVVPPDMQGRVFTLVMSVTQALAPLGLLVAGPTAEAIGVQYWYVLAGAVIAMVGVGALLTPALVRIEEQPNRPVMGPIP